MLHTGKKNEDNLYKYYMVVATSNLFQANAH